jgi:hypothetical protein
VRQAYEPQDKRLRDLLDKQDIHEVLMRYCRGVDRCDAELIGSAFHPDAIIDYGPSTPPRQPNPEATISALRKMCDSSMHFVGNQLIEVIDDRAISEAYFVTYLVVTRDAKQYTRARGGRYIDRFERRSGEWRIAYRSFIDEWSRLDEVTEIYPAGEPYQRGIRSRQDPAYHTVAE